MPLVVMIDLALYLACSFARLTLMSHQAKSDRETNLRYFVEELMISSTALLVAVAVGAAALGGAARPRRRRAVPGHRHLRRARLP
jgi:hypothetical protein